MRWLHKIVVLSFLLLPVQSWAAQTLLDTDAFNTGSPADGTALATYNANWNALATNLLGQLETRTSGVSSPGAFTGNYRTGQTWTNNQWAELTADGTNLANDDGFGRFWIVLRASTGADLDAYVCGVYPNGFNNIYRIGKFNTNIYTNLATEAGSVTQQTTDIVNCQIDGTTITLKVTRAGIDAFTPFTATDSDFSTGNPAIALGHGTSTHRMGGSWRAGSVTAGAATSRTLMLLGVGQ